MKKIILSCLFVTGCVGIPKYVERYECSEKQKEKLPTIFTQCVRGLDSQKFKPADKTKACYDYALMSSCSKKASFQHRDFLGRGLAPLDCREAMTSWELFVCEGK